MTDRPEEKRPLKTGEAAKVLRMSETKLRTLEEHGVLVPVRLPASTHRRWLWNRVAALAEALYGEAPTHPDDA